MSKPSCTYCQQDGQTQKAKKGRHKHGDPTVPYHPAARQEFPHSVQADNVPIISRMPRFMMSGVLQIGNDRIGSISSFETPIGVRESTPYTLEWVQENLAGAILEMPEVMAE